MASAGPWRCWKRAIDAGYDQCVVCRHHTPLHPLLTIACRLLSSSGGHWDMQVRLWDTLFADAGGRTSCLLRLCTAMLLNVRQELLQVC